MPRLLFVCTANIVRSASAELLTRHRMGREPAWEVESAGVQALVGAGVDPPVADALRRRGVDPVAHSARQVDAEILTRADLILTFDTAHRQWILQEAPTAIGSTFTIRRAAKLLERIPRRAEALGFLADDGTAYSEADDFADPYGRGGEAAERAVAEIDDLLARILPAIDAVSRS